MAIDMDMLIWINRYGRWLYATFVVVTFTGALNRLGLDSKAFALCYAGIIPVLALNYRSFMRAFSGKAWAYVFPALCLISVFWSFEPGLTVRHGIQLIFTVTVGLWVGSVFKGRDLLLLASTGLGICVLMSVLGMIVPGFDVWEQEDYVGAERFFVGVYDQKNTLGTVLLLFTLSSLFLAQISGKVAYGIVLALVMAPLLIISKSTTAQLLYLLMFGAFMVMQLVSIRRVPLMPLALMASTLIVMLLLMSLLFEFSAVEAVLNSVGKDTDLSGRTTIWDVAFKHIDTRPWLGVGYHVFWSASQFVGDALYVKAAVFDTIHNFHNVYLEIAVGLGVFGVLVFLAVPLTLGVRYFLEWKSTRSFFALFGVFLVLLLLFRGFVEASLYFPHQVDVLLLSAVWAGWYQARPVSVVNRAGRAPNVGAALVRTSS